MWDGHLELIQTAKNQIALAHADVRPVHSGPYRASPKARQFAEMEIDCMLQEHVIEPARAE